MAKLALVDDHTLIRQSLGTILRQAGHHICIEASHGRELMEMISDNLPDIVLLDCVMPVMDGMETAEWLKAQHPGIKVLALSMNSDDMTVIRMLKAGARGFVLKGAETSELLRAISDVEMNGFFFSDFISDKLIWAAQGGEMAKLPNPLQSITAREQEFLQLACSEMTYKEIADKMYVSARTVDGYRESLFDKLGLKSRVGLVLYSIRNRLVEY